MDRNTAIDFLKNRPDEYARLLGFNRLGTLHRGWIREMVLGEKDKTLQASRETYKTTSVSIALAEYILLLPRLRTMFMRKTDTDVKEVVKQVAKILLDPHSQYLCRVIYGVPLVLTTHSATEISTNLVPDIKGTSQLVGMGLGSSLTGKHFDRIFTDDIVNINDRISKAERERTKLIYQELINVKNRGGKITNTGTPWHPDDAFSIMPPAEQYNCYHPEIAKIITPEDLAEIKESMSPSLFAANYELRHIASEEVIFTEPVTDGDPAQVENGIMHIDSAYYGEDYTAWTCANKHGETLYLYGQLRRKHVEDCYDEIFNDYTRLLARKAYNETNADKGYAAKDMRRKGMKVVTYAETMNKYLKIVSYLKGAWKNVVFVKGTDPDYIQQICDYFEDAEHDDAPDSAASIARLFYAKKDTNEYTPLWT